MKSPLGLVAVDDVQELLLLAHSIIQKHIDLGAGWIAFAVGGHDDKAISRRRRAEDRRPADCQRLNALVHDPYPSVIDPANLRHQFSGQWQSRLTVGPVGSATAQQPN